jgi:zinc transport system substrate-binding protein
LASALQRLGNPVEARPRDKAEVVEVETVRVAARYADAGIPPKMIDGTGAKTAVLDPLGSDLEPGPDLYPQMLRNLATSLAGCLARS